MRQRLFLVFVILNFFTALYGVKSQTAEEIIDSYAEAIGGADKIMSIKTMKYTGTYSANGPDIPLVIIVKRDNKARTEMDYQGMKMIRACEGNTGWVVNPFSGTRDADLLPAEEVKDLKKNSEIEGQLINYKEKGYRAEFLEKDDFEGSEVYKIKLTDKDGDVTYYFIDVETSLLLMDKSKRKVGEKEITSQTVYGNYQKIDGIMFPMAYEFRSSGDNDSQKLTIDKIEINIPVEDSIFKVPAAN